MIQSVPNCPNCGNGFDALARSTRMFDCPSCGTTLFREEDALAPLGNHGEMHASTMLVSVGDHVTIDRATYHVIGHARFDYGRGWWDEMWALNGDGDGVWISVDEGDVALQHPVPSKNWPRDKTKPRRGERVQLQGIEYRVTEADRAACLAIRGQLPEVLEMGETHDFVNAQGPGRALASGEFWDGGRDWFAGFWVDPFDIRIDRA